MLKFWFQTGKHILQAYSKYDDKASTIVNLNPDFLVSYLCVLTFVLYIVCDTLSKTVDLVVSLP